MLVGIPRGWLVWIPGWECVTGMVLKWWDVFLASRIHKGQRKGKFKMAKHDDDSKINIAIEDAEFVGCIYYSNGGIPLPCSFAGGYMLLFYSFVLFNSDSYV